MSIAINSNWERDQYIAAAGQTVFAYSFPIYDETYISVYQRGFSDPPDNLGDLLTLGGDYLVTGAGNEAGGTIILNVPATENDIITVIGTEPIDRESVFDDLNTFTVTLNSQLNQLTIMVKQVETILDHLTPKYRYDELVSDEVRQENRWLPILNDGYIWVGRGNYGDNPDDIISVRIGDFDALGLLNARYLLTGPEPLLPNAQDLGSLGEGILYNEPNGDGKSNIVLLNIGTGLSLDTATNTLSSTGGGGVTATVNQPMHMLSKGDWIRRDFGTNTYVKAQANSSENAEVIGVVSSVIDASKFVVQQAGLVDLTGASYTPLSDGLVYFLSESTSGLAQLAEPSTPGEVSRPVMVAVSANTGFVLPYRGQEIDVQGAASLGNGVNIITVNQSNHMFNVENVLRVSASGQFAKAQANSFSNAQAVGIVVEVIDADNFKLQTEGFTSVFSSKTATNLYYLSDVTAGLLTTTKPTAAGSFTKPMFVALTASSGFILEQRQLAVEAESAYQLVNQAGHMLAVEDVVRIDGSGNYVKAQANSMANARASGIVVNVIDADNFVVQQSGYTTAMTGKTPGQHYWLSAGTSGLLTPTEPTTSGQVSKPMFRAKSATEGWILEQRPMLQPNANGGVGGSGGTILLQTTVIAGGETEIVFEGFDSAYYKYFMEIEDLVWENGATELPAYFGNGSGPVVYDTNFSYTDEGVPVYLSAMNLLPSQKTAITATPCGPINARYQISDITQVGSAYMKNLQMIAGAERTEGGILNMMDVNAGNFSWLWYQPTTSWLAGTGFKIDCTKNGLYVSATFTRGTVRFYGVLA